MSRRRPLITADDREALLRVRRLPLDDLGGPTWFQVATAAAALLGADGFEMLSLHKAPMACRARWLSWALLSYAGYSAAEIERGWHVDHTTVLAGIRQIPADQLSAFRMALRRAREAA
jgi:hypothetical protein